MEKRKLERFSLELEAWICVADEKQKQKTIEGMTINICSGGAFFKMVNPLSVGTAVDIKMLLAFNNLNTIGSKGPYINVPGLVIRTEENGMAVIFDERCKISPLAPCE